MAGTRQPLYRRAMTLRLTDTLILRPLVAEDFEAMAALMGDPDVTRYLYWGPRTREEARDPFEKRRACGIIAPGVTQLSLGIEESGRLIGEVALMHLDNPHRDGELGYMLVNGFGGRGIASCAAGAMLRIGFEQLKLHRIHARCDDRNIASWRVMEKIGLRREAHHLSNEWVKGEWTGALVYALLENEWEAASR